MLNYGGLNPFIVCYQCLRSVNSIIKEPAYTDRAMDLVYLYRYYMQGDLSHATEINMGKSSIIV